MKLIVTLLMLGLSSLSLADVTLNGGVGYRYDATQVDSADRVTKDRVKAELVANAKISDNANAVVGLRTGTVNSAYADFGNNANQETIGLNLAYVDYAASDAVKVTVGKMNQPWVNTSALLFDKDVKPTGLAVGFKNKSGLFANASSVTITEGGVVKDTKVYTGQVGAKKSLLGLTVTGGVGYFGYAIEGVDIDAQQAFLNVGVNYAGVPVNLFYEGMKNTQAATGRVSTAGGIKVGNAVMPEDWEVTVLYQEVGANSQYALWQDSDFAGGQGDNRGLGIIGSYVLAKNVKAGVKFFDVDRKISVGREGYKRLLLDLNYTF